MRCGNCPTTFCQYRKTDGECVFNAFGPLEEVHGSSGVRIEVYPEPKEVTEILSRNQRIKSAAQSLVDAVERYTRQECLRSELMNKVKALKELL